MQINKTNNHAFGAIYYQAFSNRTNRFHMSQNRSDLVLSPKQYLFSKLLDNVLKNKKVSQIHPACKHVHEISLERALADRNTDIYVRYTTMDTVEVSLLKKGINENGDSYCYIPYGDSLYDRYATTFSLKGAKFGKDVQEKALKFTADIIHYLSDTNNPLNKAKESGLI